MLKPGEVFKRYDIRGKYPGEINEEFARRLGQAIGSFTQDNYGKKVVIGRDNKKSSITLKQALIEGLKSTGIEVLDAGEGPTDYVAFSGVMKDSVSVQVTASHLPLNFNGFKLMYPEGNGFVNEDLEKVKDLFRSENFREGQGALENIETGCRDRYREEIKEAAREYSEGLFDKKIVVDTLGGAATGLLPELLKDLGAEVIDISEEKEEFPYRDPPNPKPDNLEELKSCVKEENADLGLATDMDGDRITVYSDGFLSGDEVFSVMSDRVRGEVVASVDSSQAVEDVVEDKGHEIYYTRVGDPFVMDKAFEVDASLAGEPNGHYSVLEFVPYNSGTLIALIAAGLDLKKELEDVPEYSILRESIEIGDEEERMLLAEETIENNYEILSRIDGVKALIEGAEVLIRPSGSSHKIRVIAEADDKEVAEKGLEAAMDILRKA